MDGGPGIVVQEWISNSTDFLQNQFLKGYNDFRLYPTELSTQANGLTFYTYHLNLLPNHGEPSTVGVWLNNDYWVDLDRLRYNNLAVDDFIIGINKDGIVQSVESSALLLPMYRQS